MRVYPSDRIGRAYRPRRGQRKKKGGRGILKRLSRILINCVLFLVLLSWLLVLPVRWMDPPTTAFMLQDDSDQEPVRYAWTAWEEIGDSLPLAAVAAEDQKFSGHMGFDVKSIRDSVEEYANGASLRGASTITQQVAKNLYLWRGRSFVRKGVEAYLTVVIEATLSKKRILEIYLNIAEFGPGTYGVGAASQAYFGKSPKELSDTEAALLTSVLPNPKKLQIAQPSPHVRERQSWIVNQMQRLRREQWSTSLDD